MSRKVSLQSPEKGKHILRWREDGTHRSKTVNGSARLAERRRAEIEDRLASGIKDASKVTLDEVAKLYFADGRSRWTDKTVIGYAEQYNSKIAPYLGHLKITEIRIAHVRRWQATLAANGIGQESQRKTLTRLRAVLNFAVDEELIERNVALRAKMPKKPVPEQIRPATADDTERARAIYLERGQLRDAMIWSLLTYQVIRVGEVFGLRGKSVDLDNALLIIDARLTVRLDEDDLQAGDIMDGDKRYRSRTIDLHPSVVAELREYLAAIGNPQGDELLFPYADGEPFTKSQYDSWRRNRFKRVAKKIGRGDLTPKMLRHSSVSIYLHCLGAGKLAYIARQAGHAQTMLLSRYSHEIDGLEDGWGLSVEQVIQKARRAVHADRAKLTVA